MIAAAGGLNGGNNLKLLLDLGRIAFGSLGLVLCSVGNPYAVS
jgi:hypothetical protein